MKLDNPPEYAFGIKHSPYLGSLKGDAWAGSTTETTGNATTRPRDVPDTSKITNATTTPAVPTTQVSNGHVQMNGHTSNAATLAANAAARFASTKTVVKGDSQTTTSSRVHSDGHRIRTETFSYTKGPTVTTSSVAVNRTSRTETKAIAWSGASLTSRIQKDKTWCG